METNQTINIQKELSISVDFPRKKKENSGAINTENLKQNIQERQIKQEEIKRKIEELVRNFSLRRELKMYYDEDINKLVITVVDGDSQRVIRQIPDQETLNFIKQFQQYIGVLINRRI